MLSQFRKTKAVRCRSSSPFTSFLLTFGKLTLKLELLSQFRKAESRRPFRGCLRKSSPFTSFSLTFGKLSTKFEMLCKKPKSAVSESLRGDERVRARRERRAREGRQTSVASGRLRRGRFAPSKKQGCRAAALLTIYV